MTSKSLTRSLANADRSVERTRSSGAPHYTLPPHEDVQSDGALTLEQAQALHKGAVPPTRSDVHAKAFG